MQNVNLLFNKLYYDELSIKGNAIFVGKIDKKRDSLIKSKFYEDDYQKCKLPGVSKLYFKILYPGLLIGTGYAHGVSSEDDAKLGFSLDYVTGQPYIPGSSVKGTLRSIFEVTAIIKEIFEDNKITEKYSENKIENIIQEIFEGNDIFLDAVLYCGNEEGRVLGLDYITPHKNPVKNPTPIQMIKILPNVIIEFRFILKKGNLSVEDKLAVFSQIIEDFGIGAKTNVGYGNIIKVNKPQVDYPKCTPDDRKREEDAIVVEKNRC